ncbi:MAG: ABC transporter substrate-binding protein [Pseudomonadota bacterium]
MPATTKFVAAAAVTALMSTSAFADSPKPATGSLTIAQAAESTMLDVTRAAAGVDWYILGNINEQLLQPNPDLEVENWLAEKWETREENGKPVIEVWLRKGVMFHHGGELTADDMVFAQQRLGDPDVSKWPHYQAKVEKIEVLGTHHFKIIFNEPDALYLAGSGLMRLWGVSRAYYESHTNEEIAAQPDGTGPWKLKSRKVKEEFVLEAFDDYWNHDHRPGVKDLTIKIIPEDITRVAALQTGAVDWIDAVPPAMVEDVQGMEGIVTTARPSGNNLFMGLPQYLDALPGMDKNPFKDVRVRLAAAHAVDMDGIIEGVLFGQAQRYTTTTPGAPTYDPSIQPYAYDPGKAKELLAEAGYPNGFDVNCYNLITPREPNIKEYGEAFFAYLSQVGIRCNVIGEEYSPWLARNNRSREPQSDGIFTDMWGHGVVPDPGTPWSGMIHCYKEGEGWGSYSHYCDPELDPLIEEQASVMDPAERIPLVKKLGKIKYEQVAGGITTYVPLVTFAWREAKVDYNPWPWAGFWRKLQEIGIKQ